MCLNSNCLNFRFHSRENKKKLVIDVGMGIFVELTYKEAKDFIFTQKIELERLLRKTDIDIVDIKTNIKMVTKMQHEHIKHILGMQESFIEKKKREKG